MAPSNMKILPRLILAFILVAFMHHSFAKDELKLTFALDLVRHGDRAPIEDFPALSNAWKQEEFGQLTELGAKDAEALGKKFREYYINKTHLLPESFDFEATSVRSTNFQRTIDTARNLMKGFYPKEAGQIEIEVPPLEEDVLMRNRTKFRYEEFKKLGKLNEEIAANSQSEPYPSIRHALGELNQIFGTNYSAIGEASGIGDLLRASKIHNRPLLKKIDANLEEKFIKLLDKTRLLWFRNVPAISCIFAQDFISYVADLIDNNSRGYKYVLYAGHDSSILGSLVLLNYAPSDYYELRYLANLRFEIFQNTKTNDAFVKTSFDGKALNICSTELCPVNDFVKTLKANVEDKCKQGINLKR